MPTWLICIPLVLQWIVLAVRYRSATLPAAANSAITSGDLVGEGKLEYFRDMGPLARAAWQCHRQQMATLLTKYRKCCNGGFGRSLCGNARRDW